MNGYEYSDDDVALLDEPRGVAIKFHLPRLSDDDVTVLERWGRQVAEAAPTVGAIVQRAAVNEHWRRIGAEQCDNDFVREPEFIRLPVVLTNDELADGLAAVAAATYAVRSYLVGELFDKVHWALMVMVQNRLRTFG